MIDTHCHLDHCHDVNEAHDPTLKAMVTIGTTLERCERTLELCDTFDNVYGAVGIHPCNAYEANDAEVRARIADMAQHPKVVGIGESGFDYYWDDATPEDQRMSFLWQAELAAALDKPLILHVRDKQGKEKASLETLASIQEVGLTKGILHCCNGHEALYEAGMVLGWMVSFAGNVTYKNATEIHAIAKAAPKDRILVETDSPFLAPVPKRGKRNQPGYVRYTAAHIAALRDETPEALEALTDANATRIYNLPF